MHQIMTHFENFIQIKRMCLEIVKSRNINDIVKLGDIIREKQSRSLLQSLQSDLLATFYGVLKNEAKNTSDLRIDDKLIVIEILDMLLKHINLDNPTVFFNLFGFFITEIYDSDTHEIKNIPEEYKLAIVTSTKSLLNCTTTELTEILYTKENGSKLCRMIYVAVQIAKNEKFRTLRIEAIECLMALFKVLNESDYSDILFRSLVAKCFSYFLPGVSFCLKNVALNDEKVGFKLIQTSIKAMGRIVSLLMQDYDETCQFTSLQYVLNCMQSKQLPPPEPIQDKKEAYMEAARNVDWFHKADTHLAKLLPCYKKLTQHPIVAVRKELAEMCCLILEKSAMTCPKSCRYFAEILIILSEDEEEEIKEISNLGLNTLILNDNRIMSNQIQDGFYEAYSEIPTIFNGLDDKQKVAILRLVTGYLNCLKQNVQHNNFRQFMYILLNLCEFDVDISTFEEKIQDLHSDAYSYKNKNFKFLNDEIVRKQFTNLCHALAQHFEIVLDFLVTIHEEIEERMKATYFLNELMSGLKTVECNKSALLKPIFTLYIKDNWKLRSDNLSLKNMEENIQQAALNIDGIGIIADVLGEEFRVFLMHCLFHVLTRAGSGHLIVQIFGRKALKNIANALGYSEISFLIHDNMDYITMYIEKNLRCDSTDIMDVLEVLFKFSSRETLENIIIIMEEVLHQSRNKFYDDQIDFYLYIFRAFLKCELKLFEIHAEKTIFKTKAEKESEQINFQVTGLNEEINDFSDNIMGKSAEELYKEDLERGNMNGGADVEVEAEEYKKEPPNYIRITVGIMKRSLNFLPSKQDQRKVLVLEILKDGLEIIKNFEDELLPVVHLIWSPLVQRFKESSVIINYSIQLLRILARVSKDFIRNRTKTDVLPVILDVLTKLSKESYMKGMTSPYRFTQSYKLQITIFEHLGYILCDINASTEDIDKVIDVCIVYLDYKQSVLLLHATAKFLKVLIKYEPTHINKIGHWFKDKDFLNKMNEYMDVKTLFLA